MVNSGRGSLALAIVEKWQSVLEILSVESCLCSHFAEPRSKGGFQEVKIHPWSFDRLTCIQLSQMGVLSISCHSDALGQSNGSKDFLKMAFT